MISEGLLDGMAELAWFCHCFLRCRGSWACRRCPSSCRRKPPLPLTWRPSPRMPSRSDPVKNTEEVTHQEKYFLSVWSNFVFHHFDVKHKHGALCYEASNAANNREKFRTLIVWQDWFLFALAYYMGFLNSGPLFSENCQTRNHSITYPFCSVLPIISGMKTHVIVLTFAKRLFLLCATWQPKFPSNISSHYRSEK